MAAGPSDSGKLSPSRTERLAAELRANLKRRREQARARSADASTASEPPAEAIPAGEADRPTRE